MHIMPQCGAATFFGTTLPFPLEAEEDEFFDDSADHEDNSWADQLTPLLERMQPLIQLPSVSFAFQLLDDMRVLMRLITRDDRPVDVVVLATRLAAVGYRVVVRTAIGGGDACFRNLHNEFLCVIDTSAGRPVEYIVEPSFKSHFKISSPTPLYNALYEKLPTDFVGTAERLTPLVQLLCSEMHASFKQQSLTMPPWRQARSMLSKWLPVRSRDSPAMGPIAAAQPQQESQQDAQQELLQPLTAASASSSDQQYAASDQWQRAAGSSPSGVRKSLLASKLQTVAAKAPPANMVVMPSQFQGQPPTYKVRIGV